MSRLLHVLGGGPWQVPTIQLAKRAGYSVLVTDWQDNCAAQTHADACVVADITDIEATMAAAKQFQVDGIICDSTDVGVPTAAYVAEQLGLPGIGYEVAQNFTNKAKMRWRTSQQGIESPDFCVLRSGQLIQELVLPELPFIVKPTDSQSGKGVTWVSNREDLTNAIDYGLQHSRRGELIAESIVFGQEVIVDGFVLDGQVQLLGIAKKTPYEDQPTICSRITYGRVLDEDTLRVLERLNSRVVVESLGLRWGIFHAEYKICRDFIVPIDVAARGGGCMIYTHVLPALSGFDANLGMIRLSMGQDPGCPGPLSTRAANIEFVRLPVGDVLVELQGVEEARNSPGVVGLHLGISPGARIQSLRKKDDRPGFIVTMGDTVESAIAAAEIALSNLRFRFEGDGGWRQALP